MNRLVSRTLVLAVALAAGGVSAQDYRSPDYGYEDGYGDYRGYDDRSYEARGSAYDLARVTRVEPIVERSQPVSRRECWREASPVQEAHDYYDPYANPRYARRDPRRPSGSGAVLGAIVGGVLGNTVGDGDGRRAATAVGAVVGGVVGNSMERDARERQAHGYRGEPRHVPMVERCRRVLAEVEEAESALSARQTTPAGKLAIVGWGSTFGPIHQAVRRKRVRWAPQPSAAGPWSCCP